MVYIKEPQNVDFIVSPSTLTNDAKLAISKAIAVYKSTGVIPENVTKATTSTKSINSKKVQTKHNLKIGRHKASV